MAVFALILAAALAASDPDGIVATAPATAVDLSATAQPTAPSVEGAVQEAVPHGLSTDEQIERWMAARSIADKPWAEAVEEIPDDRKVHGEVSFGIGTGGYRDYGVAMSLPIGETARLDIRYRQIENGYPYGGYGYGYGYGYGDPYFSDGRYGPGRLSGAAVEFESRGLRPDDRPDPSERRGRD
ncbi:hypothetical protein [Brevundimonas sp.]|uniref:hypothetical protein n=1 Tax=Brevundimonas sp. TaxID=1871086 RepID=UPI002737CA4E|nr:hypothetical protein [Brevundimonas sp.]MDP3801582.1 hypothetical protein [Brevundimonas sp.]